MKRSEDTNANCRIVDAELDRVSGEPSGEALRHLEECGRCRALHAWLSERPPAAGKSLEALQERLKRSLSPVRPEASLGVLVARSLSAIVFFSLVAIVLMGKAGLAAMTSTQFAGMLSVLIGAATALSLSLAWQITPGSLQRFAPSRAILTVTALFLLSAAVLFPWLAPVSFLSRGWVCLRAGIAITLLGAGLLYLLVRRGHALAGSTLGATVGALSGFLSVLVLQLECGNQDAIHLLVWHGGVLAASIGLGIVTAKGARYLA
jgi:hypothetical protein